MTEMREKKVKAFIGPDESCTTEALLASAWNTPMLSFVSPLSTNVHSYTSTLSLHVYELPLEMLRLSCFQ